MQIIKEGRLFGSRCTDGFTEFLIVMHALSRTTLHFGNNALSVVPHYISSTPVSGWGYLNLEQYPALFLTLKINTQKAM